MGIWSQTHTVGKESASWLALWWEKQTWVAVVFVWLVCCPYLITAKHICALMPVHSCRFTGCWLHGFGGGCGGKETGINQSWKTCPQFYDGYPANKKSKQAELCTFTWFLIPDISTTALLTARLLFCSGEKHSCECSQGDMAHLQEHQTGEEDGPRQSQEAPEEISPSHSPVGATPLSLTLSTLIALTSSSPTVYLHDTPTQHEPKIWIVWHL